MSLLTTANGNRLCPGSEAAGVTPAFYDAPNQRLTRLMICGAAIATFQHRKNTAAVTFAGAIGNPARPTRTILVVSDSPRVALIASCMLV